MKYKTSVALGFFDGVHQGHRMVVQEAVKHSENPSIFSFNLGGIALESKGIIKQILSDEVRMQMLKTLKAKVVIVPFSDISQLSPYEFVTEMLKKKLNTESVFCGASYRFGKSAQGNVTLLKELCKKENIAVHIIPAVVFDGDVVSSTSIRNHLLWGEIEKANELLGYNYFVESEVIRGKKIGRMLNTPTINQSYYDYQLIPKYGVYASKVYIDGKEYSGATNIGIRPTIGDMSVPSCETHIIDYDNDVYGKIAKVVLYKYIRGEKYFNNHEALQQQIKIDIINIKKSL